MSYRGPWSRPRSLGWLAKALPSAPSARLRVLGVEWAGAAYDILAQPMWRHDTVYQEYEGDVIY